MLFGVKWVSLWRSFEWANGGDWEVGRLREISAYHFGVYLKEEVFLYGV